MLRLASHGRTPIPNGFFAAIHWLLLRDPSQALARYYPSIEPRPRPVDAELWSVFRAFVLDRREEIRATIATRLTQTNEVRRCGYLLPAFAHVAALAGEKPLGLIEIGCSAALNLCFDRYAYDYGSGRRFGKLDASLALDVEVQGISLERLPTQLPRIDRRVGIDLNPIDADDSVEVDWLRALIWPEHHDRRALLERVLEVVRSTRVDLRRGDAAELIESVLDEMPREATPCVFQTHTLNQFPPAAREKLNNVLVKQGRRREVFFVSRLSRLTLDRFAPAGHERVDLAETDGHGRWFRWLVAGVDR